MAPEDSVPNNNQFQITDLISLDAAAGIFGLSHGHLALLVRRGELWGMKIGRNWVTTEAAVRGYLAKGLHPGPKSKKSI